MGALRGDADTICLLDCTVSRTRESCKALVKLSYSLRVKCRDDCCMRRW